MPMNGFGTKAAVNQNGSAPILPSFFVIGPPRTGTSWLHMVLSECAWLSHPTKETRFFDKYFDLGLQWYHNHYRNAGDDRPVGEIAPTYFASPEARERIARLLPAAKIVCTFRNPVDRVLSLYRLKRAYGMIPWAFDDALARDPELMESSLYATHLTNWLKAFGPSQVMVTLYEDLQSDPQSYVDKVVDFLGVPRRELRPPHKRRVFTAETMTEPRNYFLTRGALRFAEWSKKQRIGSFVYTAKKWGAARLFLGGGPPFPEVPPSEKMKLRELFRGEVDKLEAMLNRDLSAWK